MPSQSVRSRIVGTGAYAPERVVTNFDLAKLVDTSDEWITERTGIKERRFVADGQAASDLAYEASTRALDAAKLKPADLDMIIVGTISSDMRLPACAAFLQQKLGAGPIPSFDLGAACAGFVYSLSVADQFMRTGAMKAVLVVGTEVLSRITNFTDRNTCVLFGDGAGAVVLQRAEEGEAGVLSTSLHTDSSLATSLMVPAGGSLEPLTHESLNTQRDKIYMNGQDIFKVAVRNLTSASRFAISAAGLETTGIQWVVPHQANLRIIAQVSQRLTIPMERFIINIERYGNTSSASIPMALDEGVRDGRIKPGDTVLMCALGAGVSWASALIRM
ncbi:MAG: ketoacyl-ACP synthase III [Polyangiaceae bacterium]|nr:ketoacyl-ACP synthase III [Polyangiaceae bacterium]